MTRRAPCGPLGEGCESAHQACLCTYESVSCGGNVGQEVDVADNYLVAFEDEAVRHFGSHREGRYISRRSRHVWVVARLALISGIYAGGCAGGNARSADMPPRQPSALENSTMTHRRPP